MIIRKATEQDAGTLSSLHKEAFTRFYSEQDFYRFLEDGCFCFVAEENKITGFILTQRSGDDAEILSLVVTPLVRRQGIGKKLLTQTEEELRAQNLQSVFLEVRDGNIEAQDLYSQNGYTQIAMRPNYYQHGDLFFDAIVMRKDLTP